MRTYQSMKRPAIVRRSFGADVNVFDWSNLACDTLGGFRIEAVIIVKSAVGGSGYARVNGSSSTSDPTVLFWFNPVRSGYPYVAGYSPGGLITGDVISLVITCESPASGKVRAIRFSGHHHHYEANSANWKSMFHNCTCMYVNTANEITSVGLTSDSGVPVFDAGSHYSITRFP